MLGVDRQAKAATARLPFLGVSNGSGRGVYDLTNGGISLMESLPREWGGVTLIVR